MDPEEKIHLTMDLRYQVNPSPSEAVVALEVIFNDVQLSGCNTLTLENVHPGFVKQILRLTSAYDVLRGR